MITLATKITFLRIVLILPIIYLTYLATFYTNLFALIIFIFAGLTDYLDGFIARKTNTETKLGGLLDLLADKLLVSLVLIWLVTINNSLLFVIPVLLIVLREFIISSTRQFMVEMQGKNNVQVSIIGKSKTTVQLIATALIIISPNLGPDFYNFSLTILWLASFISLFSLYIYLSQWLQMID